MPGDRAGVAVRMGPTALSALLLAAAIAASVFYAIALASDDDGVMRLVNGGLPALVAADLSFAGSRQS